MIMYMGFGKKLKPIYVGGNKTSIQVCRVWPEVQQNKINTKGITPAPGIWDYPKVLPSYIDRR